MAEALGVIEVVLGIGSAVNSLYEYISAARDARDDIRRLAQELLALRGALEFFDAAAPGKADADGPRAEGFESMLLLTRDVIASIEKKLAPPAGRLGRAAQRLTWPFKSGDVEKYLASVERSKTWFVMVMMRERGDESSALQAEMQRLVEAVGESVVAQRADVMVAEMEGVLNWLAPVNSAETLAKVTRSRVAGTGDWIWEDGLDAWESRRPTLRPFFWVTGKSGSGKTVLFSNIVERIQERCLEDQAGDRGLAFHCCSLDDAASQQVGNVLGSIMAAMTKARPELVEIVRPMRNSNKALIAENNLSPGQRDAVFRAGFALFDRFYILVDALNETPHGQQVVDQLLALCQEYPNVRVLVTSTKRPDEESAMTAVREMQAKNVDADIKTYVATRLASEPSFSGLSPTIRSEVEEKLVHGSNGMFRWAKLCMDRLSTLRTGRDVRLALCDLPTTLNDTYITYLERIPRTDRELVKEALSWLCFALWPLRLAELAEAVILRESDTQLDGDCRLNNPNILLDICQGMVHAIDDRVTLAHDSIRSFLLSDTLRLNPSSDAAFFALDPHACHARIMRKCVVYLCLDAFRAGPIEGAEEFVFREDFTIDESDAAKLLRKRHQDYPLLDYASRFWPIHSERCTLTPPDESLILDFFATKKLPGGSSFDSWVQVLMDDTSEITTIRRSQPLYYAASFNMTAILRILLRPELGFDLNMCGGRYGSPPLLVAIFRRNWEAVEMLLRAGADPDSRDGLGTSISCRQLAAVHSETRILALMEEMKPRAVPEGGEQPMPQSSRSRVRFDDE